MANPKNSSSWSVTINDQHEYEVWAADAGEAAMTAGNIWRAETGKPTGIWSCHVRRNSAHEPTEGNE